MQDLEKINILLKLKEVNRVTRVLNRNESSAEHTYGCLMLADYFLNKFKINLDKEKVMQLLLYHDFVEIESGDTYFMDEEGIKNQKTKEQAALRIIQQKIPQEISQKYVQLFNEYEEAKTPEAKFAQAIDKLEPMIHALDYKKLWHEKGFTEKNIREKKQKPMESFPELLTFFNEIMEFLKTNGYFKQ